MSDQYSGAEVSSAQPQSRGCAVMGVVAAVLVLVVLVAGAVWYLLSRDSPVTGDFESAPECATGETAVLDELVPDHVLEVEEPVGTAQDPSGNGWQCRWATPEDGVAQVPATATLVTVAAPDPGGLETASDNLRATTQNKETQPVEGIGDEAVSWTQEGSFEIGCVGTRVSNLFMQTCYGSAGNYDATLPGDAERNLEGAQLLARSVVDTLPE